MKRHIMFIDWKTQHSKDINSLKINKPILYNSYEDFVYILTRLFQNLYRNKETRIATTVFLKRIKWEE